MKKFPERVRFWRDFRGNRVLNLSSPERSRPDRLMAVTELEEGSQKNAVEGGGASDVVREANGWI